MALFGRAVRAMRLERGLSQEVLAHQAGVERSHMGKIERGELGVKTGKGFYTYPNPAWQDPEWLKGSNE